MAQSTIFQSHGAFPTVRKKEKKNKTDEKKAPIPKFLRVIEARTFLLKANYGRAMQPFENFSWQCQVLISLKKNKQILGIMHTSILFLFVCVEVLRPSQPNGVMSSAVSLPNHTFTGQA